MTSKSTDEEYEHGFRDGIIFVAKTLRIAAERVERPTYDTFTHRDSGREFKAISKAGQPHLAKKYRELADELEHMVTQ